MEMLEEDCSEITGEQFEFIKDRIKMKSRYEILIISTPNKTEILKVFSNTNAEIEDL